MLWFWVGEAMKNGLGPVSMRPCQRGRFMFEIVDRNKVIFPLINILQAKSISCTISKHNFIGVVYITWSL